MKPNTPLTLLALAAGALLAQHASAGDLPNGRYTINPVNSGKCVDVAWASTADGANIAQVACNGNNAQVFDVVDTGSGWYKLTNVNSGKVMDVAANSGNDGANIQQWSDNGSGAQRFSAKRVNGIEFVLTNKTSGKCVDVAGGSSADGANIQQWSCNGGSAQRYRFVPVGMAGVTLPVGRYTLKSVHSGMCLDVAGASTADNANIQQWSCNGSGAQAFDLSADAGNYHVLNANSGKSLDVANQSSANGANVLQWPWWGGNNQRFTLVDRGSAQYEVHFRHSDKCMDVDGWSTAAGGNVQQWACGGNQANQKWIFTPSSWGSSSTPTTPPPPPPTGWVQVWADEFDGSSIDRNKWNFEVNGGGGGNNELQYYTDRAQNAFVQNGKLVIQANRERYCSTDGCRDYTSARLNSNGKGDWLYGRFEARAKLPRGQGMWPAIWMLPTDWVYGSWPMSGEIDIMEAVNTGAAGGNAVYGSIHYGPAWPNNQHQTAGFTPSSSVADNFHTYAMEWDPAEIRMYVDGNQYARYSNWWTPNGGYPAPFNQRFHWVLNVAVGGNWPGNPDGATSFPQRMEIDWVRVFRKQ